jgi:hypothetical protein
MSEIFLGGGGLGRGEAAAGTRLRDVDIFGLLLLSLKLRK